VDQSAADALEISTVVLTEKLYGHLCQQIVFLGSRGGPLEPLANELNHEVTHRRLEQTADAIRQVAAAVEAGFARQGADHTAQRPGPPAIASVAMHIEQLLAGLSIDGHDEAERRMNRLFLPLCRGDQRVVVESLSHEASTAMDHETHDACGTTPSGNASRQWRHV